MTPPGGSRIKVEIEDGRQVVVVPQDNAGLTRYLVAVFLVLWLSMWFAGFWGAVNSVIGGSAGLFITVWLTGWTFGGLVAMRFLYRLMRPSVPERFILGRPRLGYDSGVPTFQVFAGFGMKHQLEFWRMLFPKRMVCEFSQTELATLKLRESDESNRLTIDRGTERIDLGNRASEIEREWLFEVLRSEYA